MRMYNVVDYQKVTRTLEQKSSHILKGITNWINFGTSVTSSELQNKCWWFFMIVYLGRGPSLEIKLNICGSYLGSYTWYRDDCSVYYHVQWIWVTLNCTLTLHRQSSAYPLIHQQDWGLYTMSQLRHVPAARLLESELFMHNAYRFKITWITDIYRVSVIHVILDLCAFVHRQFDVA